MKQYEVTVPPTMEMGSHSMTVTEDHGETKAEAALWYYNSARDHDGLPPLKRMPNGTKYVER
ncbi:hypothetical protein KAU33_03875 [Candidatus Dependentiae bacterium]|nr:hypothetical protein [Candidatus Dependentiae bacterium]